jgi:hypothetical protein
VISLSREEFDIICSSLQQREDLPTRTLNFQEKVDGFFRAVDFTKAMSEPEAKAMVLGALVHLCEYDWDVCQQVLLAADKVLEGAQ